MCFLCLEERKKTQKLSRQRAGSQEVFFFFFFFFGLEVPGAFYSPDTDYEAMALQGPPPSNGLRSG